MKKQIEINFKEMTAANVDRMIALAKAKKKVVTATLLGHRISVNKHSKAKNVETYLDNCLDKDINEIKKKLVVAGINYMKMREKLECDQNKLCEQILIEKKLARKKLCVSQKQHCRD